MNVASIIQAGLAMIPDNSPFHYDIRNPEIAQELIRIGFTLYNTSPDCWTLEAPLEMSATKARKVISTIIKLYLAAKELNRAQSKYDNLLNKINKLDMVK